MTNLYLPLQFTLARRDMSWADLRRKTGLSSATMTKIRKGAPVHLTTLLRITEVLYCRLGDVVEINRREEA